MISALPGPDHEAASETPEGGQSVGRWFGPITAAHVLDLQRARLFQSRIMNKQAEVTHRGIDDFIAGLALDCSAAQQALHASVRADRANFLARARRLPPQLREIVAPFAPAYQCISNFEIETRFDVIQSRGLRGRLELEPLNAYYTRAKRRDVTSASQLVVEFKYNPPGTGE